MPHNQKSESKEDFISRFMNSEEAKKEFPDEKQRLAVANSKFKQTKKVKDLVCDPGIFEKGEIYSWRNSWNRKWNSAYFQMILFNFILMKCIQYYYKHNSYTSSNFGASDWTEKSLEINAAFFEICS